MIVEILYPEFCNLFSETSNTKYLQCCLTDADFVFTEYNDEPAFVKNDVNLIYLGCMTEHSQEMIIKRLLPYRERLIELIENDTPVLATGNAMEIFSSYIQKDDGSRIDALNIFNFYAKRDMKKRFNCLMMGSFEDMTIVGFKTQFTFAYSENFNHPFIKVIRGTGMNPECQIEGIRYHNFFGTYLVGPFLVLNPDFTLYLLKKMGADNPKLAFDDVIREAYARRLKEFQNPDTKYY